MNDLDETSAAGMDNTCTGDPEWRRLSRVGYDAGASLQPGNDNVLLGDPDGRLSREWKKACENARVGWPGRTTGHDNTVLSPKPPSFFRRILSFLRSIF